MRDVIVVGAGPAGLYTARLLAEEGFEVTVVEEHPVLGVPTHCTGVVSDELFALFKVPESSILNRPEVCSVVGPSGRAVTFGSASEEIAVIDRGQFDADLGLAARQAGVEIRNSVRVDRIRVEPRRVSVAAGAMALDARACVLACGVGYRLQRQLGLGLPAVFLHSAQVEMDACEVPAAVELHVGSEIAPRGFAWIAPVAREGRARVKVGLMSDGDAAENLARFLARPGVARRVASDLPVPIRRLMPLGPASKTYADRVVAVGDAAGLTKPTTGGGIFYSMLSGALAAEALGHGLRRDRLADLDLRAYEREWRARLDPHLKVSSYLRRLFIKLADRELDALLDAAIAADVHQLVRRTAGFNWQGDVVRGVLRQQGVRSVLLRALLR